MDFQPKNIFDVKKGKTSIKDWRNQQSSFVTSSNHFRKRFHVVVFLRMSDESIHPFEKAAHRGLQPSEISNFSSKSIADQFGLSVVDVKHAQTET